MKIDYDKEADASYVTIRKGVVARTVMVSADVLIDVDANGEALGVEVLNVGGSADTAVEAPRNTAALA